MVGAEPLTLEVAGGLGCHEVREASMKARIRLITMALVIIGALSGSSCSGGGEKSSDANGAANWDSMVWDVGHWQ